MDPFSLGTAEFFARSLVAGVFLWAGAAKVGDAQFADVAGRLTGLSTRIARPVAQALPAIELAIGVSLLLPWTAQVGAAAGLMILSLFALLLARRRLQQSTDSCGCFGSQEAGPISWRDVARNIAMSAALLPATIQLPPERALPVQNAALALGGAALALLSMVVLSHLKSVLQVAKGVSGQ